MRDGSLSLNLNREDIRLGEVKMTSNLRATSREILGRIYDAKFPCMLLASVISLDLQSGFLIEQHS